MDNHIQNPGYEEGAVYSAKITDQLVSESFKNETRIILTVKVQAKLKNAKNPADGTVECPQLEREVWLTVVEDDENRLRMTVRDLEQLGFTDDDITKLHPDHPETVSLLGKEVHVRPKMVNGAEYWNLVGVREKPKPVAFDQLKTKATSIKDKMAAARKSLKDERTNPKAPKATTVKGKQPAVSY